MEKILIHDIIGKLEWDLRGYGSDYFCTREFEFMGKICKMQLLFVVDEEDEEYGEDEEPCNEITESQVKKYQYIMENQEEFFKMVEEAILNYYIYSYENFMIPTDYPKISTIEELKELLLLDSGIAIYIEQDWCDFIGVALECKWEEEHGLGVKVQDEEIWREENDIEDFKYRYLKFKNNKAIEVGFQDIIL